jgi:sarcosine oxidase
MKIAVVGGGVVGLSTTVELIRNGHDVTCFEPAEPMAERSAGDTRIFRLAHAYPDMVDLAAHSRRLFDAWGDGFVDGSGTVVSGPDITPWATAMAAAGAAHEITGPDSPLLRLPAREITGNALIDPAGGVIRVDRLRAFLLANAGPRIRRSRVDHVAQINGTSRVRVSHGPRTPEDFDSVLICAGAGTPALAAGAGLETPSALEHHVRFSFPIRPDAPGPMQCWITLGEFGTYQHMSAHGSWAIGADVDPAAVSWTGGRAAAEEASRAAVTAYVAEHLPYLEPTVTDQLYCTHNPDLSDGLQFARSGQVLTVYGENLMKFAPLLAGLLARSLEDGSTPPNAGPSVAE